MSSSSHRKAKSEKTLGRVRPELERIMGEFEKTHDNRESLIKNARDVLVLCSRSIVSVHKGDIDHGKKQFETAHKLLQKYKRDFPRDMHAHLGIAEQELTESACLISIAQNRSIPTPRSLGVSSVPYVLGMLDVIGELKRLTLDLMRAKKYDEACRIFDIAVNLYDELSGFAIFSNSVREIRKKIDVARIMLDGMRGTITGTMQN